MYIYSLNDCLNDMSFFFRWLQCSFNVPETVGTFRQCHGGYQLATSTKESLRYVHAVGRRSNPLYWQVRAFNRIRLRYSKKSFDVELRRVCAPSNFRAWHQGSAENSQKYSVVLYFILFLFSYIRPNKKKKSLKIMKKIESKLKRLRNIMYRYYRTLKDKFIIFIVSFYIINFLLISVSYYSLLQKKRARDRFAFF